VLVPLVALALTLAPSADLHRYWPAFPPAKVLVSIDKPATADEAFLLQSLSGLTARRAKNGGPREYVWIKFDGPTYQKWFDKTIANVKPSRVMLADVWALVARYKKQGLVKGYVLFRLDDTKRGAYESGPQIDSPNAATSMCGQLGGVLITKKLEPDAVKHGLKKLLDATELTEKDVFDKYAATFSKKALALVDPKTELARAEAISLDAFVTSSDKAMYERALKRLDPDSIVLGWGRGDEYASTSLGSRYGAFQTASNWLANLPVLAGGTKGTNLKPRQPKKSIWDLKWEDGVHYLAFLMSDGDNLQWLTGGFHEDGGKSWWRSPDRGKFAMGWTACQVDLAQAAPTCLDELRRESTPRDDLVLMSGGYYYPDQFGSERAGADSLSLHAKRINGYIKATGTDTMASLFATWDSPAALRAYKVFHKEIPSLQAVLPIAYAPYNAGLGKILWVDDMPVISARFMLWADLKVPKCGGPEALTKMINEAPVIQGTPTEENFSWTTVHAWSGFPTDKPGVKLGAMGAVAKIVSGLGKHVRVVTPTELAMLVRLRMKPAETLSKAIAELGVEGKRAMRALNEGDYQKAFELGRLAAGRK